MLTRSNSFSGRAMGSTALAVAVALGGVGAAQAQCTPQVARLLATGGVGSPLFGNSVSLSADGTTLMVGAPSDASSTGAGYVFTRVGSVWTQQGSKLTPTGASGNSSMGYSVALSSDGNTAVLGAYSDTATNGAGFIFVRSGGVWTQQAKLVRTGGVGIGQTGWSAAISADGNTAILGAPLDNSQVGAAYVYVRSGTSWSQQQRLAPTGAIGTGSYGISVALSSDGNTAVVGSPNDNTNFGAIYVHVRSGTIWTQQVKLAPSGASGAGNFGAAVSLSGDGNTLLTGAYLDSSSAGAAYIHTRSGVTWTQQQKLTGTGMTSAANFGRAVALDPAGTSALIGAPGDTSSNGAACVFARTGGVWSQQGAKLTGAGAIGAGGFGFTASSAAGLAATGARGDNSNVGAAYLFAASPLPSINVQPVGVTTAAGGSAVFNVSADAQVAVGYQWRRNGVPLTNGLTPGGSTASGVTTPSLTISGAAAGDSASAFDCVTSTACGSVISYPAGLAVTTPPPAYCVADLGVQGGVAGHDGLLDNNDFIVFIDAYFNQTGCP